MTEIRKATLHHLESLAGLFDNYRIFYKNSSDIDGARKFISSRLTNHDSEIFICFYSSMAVGFVHLYPLFSSTRMQKLWLLNDLFIDESYRGKGYSIALIEKAKELCKQTNACGLILETARDNVIGNSLYLKTGFKLDNEHHYYNWDNNPNDAGK